MINIKDALELIHSNVKAVSTEVIPIELALKRVAAEYKFAKFDLPRFDNSAMDGYAVTMADAGGVIKSQDTVLAGAKSNLKVTMRNGMKIMTGAPIPEGTDAVIPIENTKELEDGIKLPDNIKRGANIRKKGEDIAKGEQIVNVGDVIDAYLIALLASQGVTHIRVYKKPIVTIFATGCELKMHYEQIEEHQIFNSNAPMLIARSKELGCETKFIGQATDSLESIKAYISSALDSDLIITSGGVSVGDRDFTIDAFKELGMKTLFSKVNIKPGKPTTIGYIGKTWIVNLPGNPSAAAVNFEIFAKTIINRLQGKNRPYIAPIVTKLAEEKRIKSGKYSVLMGKFDGEEFKIVSKQGPNMISPLKDSDGIIIVTPDVEILKKNQTIRVIPIKNDLTSKVDTNLFTS